MVYFVVLANPGGPFKKRWEYTLKDNRLHVGILTGVEYIELPANNSSYGLTSAVL